MRKPVIIILWFYAVLAWFLASCTGIVEHPTATILPQSTLTFTRQSQSTSTTTSRPPTSVTIQDATATLTSTQPPMPITLGYYTGDQVSYDAVKSFSSYLSHVSIDIYSVQFDGSIVGSDDLGVLDYVRARNLQAYLCVSNYNNDPDVDRFDPELAHAAVVTYKEQVISELVRIVLDEGYSGVNIDFEDLAYSSDIEADREAFTLFISELASQLHENKLKLIISVPAKSEENTNEVWSYPYDYSLLGEYADYLQLMTYDQHGSWGDPGPVSGFDWVNSCLSYSVQQVDPARLLIGLPAYGYDWDLTASDPDNWDYVGSSFPWIEISDILSKPGVIAGWDDLVLSPYATYQEDGHDHIVWYENVDSIQIKVELVNKYHLAGLSMWALGKEDAEFWQAVTNRFYHE